MREMEERISFLLQYKFIQGINNVMLVRLSQTFKEVNYSIGQSVVKEGQESKNIYLVLEGQFEITKKFGISNVRYELPQCRFLRFSSTRKTKRVSRALTPYTMTMYSMEEDEKEYFDDQTFDLGKTYTRLSIIGPESAIGIEEAVLNCPYHFTTVTCTSIKGKLLEIPIDLFFEKVHRNVPALVRTTQQQLLLFCQRIQTFVKVHEYEIP